MLSGCITSFLKQVFTEPLGIFHSLFIRSQTSIDMSFMLSIMHGISRIYYVGHILFENIAIESTYLRWIVDFITFWKYTRTQR